MYNHNEPASNSNKLRPFLRPSVQTRPFQPAIVPPLLPVSSVPAVTRLAQPVLVRKVPVLPALSPAAALAHDARNALMALQLLSGLLEEPGVLAPEHTYLGGNLQMIAQVLNGMVGRIENLDKAQESASRATQPTLLVGAGDVLEQYKGLLQSIAGSGVQVFISAESGLPALQIEPDALARVLMNLVKNASEAMPDGGTVRVTARRALNCLSPAVLIHVTDNGAGIPAHALERIFEAGFSSKTTCSEPCGLGLAIVRELVEAVGGEVRVASKLRGGTTFEIKIPCVVSVQK